MVRLQIFEPGMFSATSITNHQNRAGSVDVENNPVMALASLQRLDCRYIFIWTVGTTRTKPLCNLTIRAITSTNWRVRPLICSVPCLFLFRDRGCVIKRAGPLNANTLANCFTNVRGSSTRYGEIMNQNRLLIAKIVGRRPLTTVLDNFPCTQIYDLFAGLTLQRFHKFFSVGKWVKNLCVI